jgi:hypothetical protein
MLIPIENGAIYLWLSFIEADAVHKMSFVACGDITDLDSRRNQREALSLKGRFADGMVGYCESCLGSFFSSKRNARPPNLLMIVSSRSAF